jgi:hypothetical protein
MSMLAGGRGGYANIDCAGTVRVYRAAGCPETTVSSRQPLGDYEALPVVAANRAAQRRASCVWDDIFWDEV